MSVEPRNLPEQEHSIKAREHEVYAKPLRAITSKKVKPFTVYLRETPPEPLAVTTKVMLWMTAAIVGLLFLAAIWRVSQRHGPRSRSRALAPSTKTTDPGLNDPIPMQNLTDSNGVVWCNSNAARAQGNIRRSFHRGSASKSFPQLM
jgi:hypothetical protein